MAAASVVLQKQDIEVLTPPVKINALTSARFFAAIYVILFHTRWGITPGSALDRLVLVGPSAVCFFFLLSGYILGVVYLGAGKSVAPRGFYIARFARIYPLYIVSVLLDAPFAVIGRMVKYGLTVAVGRVLLLVAGSTFMLQMCLPTDTVVNIPSWSLAIETVFYLSFPLLGPRLWRLKERSVVVVATALYFLSLLMYWVLVQYKSEPVSGLILPSYMAIFAIGIMLARWQRLRAEKATWVYVSDQAAWMVLTLIGVAFAGVVYASPWLTTNGIHYGLILSPVFAASIWLLSSTKILPVRWMGAKVLVILGEASYGMYLLHTPILHAFKRMNLPTVPSSYPLALGTIIGLSVLSFYFFEMPARRWVLQRLHSRPKETMEVALRPDLGATDDPKGSAALTAYN
jgi:peptidoglycan/LPS O-acetylase OafA/YrhL